GNGRVIQDQAGMVYQLHGSQGLIRLSDAVTVVPYGQVAFGGASVQVGVDPNTGNGVPMADAAFSPEDPNVLYVVPVQVTEPGHPAYKAAAKLQLDGGSPPYTVQQLYGRNPYTDSRVTISAPYGLVVFEPDFQQLRELEIDGQGNLFVLSAQADNDNDWVLVYDQAVGNPSEVCILLSGGAPACCSAVGSTLEAPTAMVLSQDASTMYLSSSVNAPDASSTQVYRFTINRSGGSVTGLTSNGQFTVQGMRYVSAMVKKPSSSDLWVIGTMLPTFDEYTTFSTNCSQNPNCMVPSWPMLAVLPLDHAEVTMAVAASLSCQDLAMPVSALFTSQTCGTGDFDGGGIGTSDIPLFVAALLASNPAPETICTGDLNDDGLLDGRDVQILVGLLLTE
ncbi:MAG TPA: hypothetical protein VMV94_01595, partial [Phycisphaerae bacterium]|nr:hypothetical protein [Phycisphaerae bacterium]